MPNAKSLFWILIGIVAGVLVGSIVNLMIVMTSFLFYVPPDDLDWNDQAAVAQFIGALPVGAFLFALAAHAAHSFVAGWVAAAIARPYRFTAAVIVGGLTLVGGILNLNQIPHPNWFGYVDLSLYLPLAIAGACLAKEKKAARKAAPQPSA
ncbi:MAG: hypothetical protein ACIALR_07215 [Blastopirellula sp. JB062]